MRQDGAGRRIRTDDLLITNQLLYQLSYAGLTKKLKLLTRRGFTTGRFEHPMHDFPEI